MANMQTTDPPLMAGVVRGDPEAWFRFVAEYQPYIRNTVNTRVAPSDVDDVCQEVFLALWIILRESGYKKGQLSGLVHTLIKFKVVDLIRRRNSHRGVCAVGGDTANEALKAIPDSEGDTIARFCEAIEQDEQLFDTVLREFRGCLTDRQYRVFEMRFLKGLSGKDTAAILRIPASRVSEALGIASAKFVKLVREKLER